MDKDLRIVNAPNNIAKGRIEIDAQINKIYYNILNNIQRDNKEFIIRVKKGEPLSDEQKEVLNKLDTIGNLRCRLSKNELLHILQRKNDRTKDEIDRRFNALQSAIFKFTTGEKSSTMVQLIGAVTEDDEDYIVNLDAQLYKYLFYNVNVGYTPINLATLFSLTGQYAQSLYILLRSWTGTKNKNLEFTVKDLREHFKVGDKYREYKNFKARVLLQAIDEVNRTGSMLINNIVEIKKGRSVTAIIFDVEDLEPRQARGNTQHVGLQQEDFKQEPIEWVENVMVSDRRILNALNAMYGDIKHGLARNTIRQAYVEFLKSDKYGKSIIDNIGLPYYMSILDRMLTDYREQTLGAGAYETSVGFDLYSDEPMDYDYR